MTPPRSMAVLACAVAAAWLLLLASPARPALAHADLQSAQPEPRSVVTLPPTQVVLKFTEPVEDGLTQIRVLDATGSRVDSDDVRLSSPDRTVATAGVRPLADGTYTVSWRNVSAVDGHPALGSYSFSVGFPTTTLAVSTESRPLFASSADPWARWFALAGVLGLFGGLVLRWVFELVVAREGRATRAGRRAEYDELTIADLAAARRRSDIALWTVAGIAVGGSLAHAVVSAASTYQIGLGTATTGDVLRLIRDTYWGRVWLARILLLAAAVVSLALAARRPRTPSSNISAFPWMLSALLSAAGAVVTLAMVSHGAATSEAGLLATFSDALHALASAVWIGGLVQLAALLSVLAFSNSDAVRSRLLPGLVPNFSLLAGISAGVLLVTGLFSAYTQVTALAAATTPYGYALIAKAAVVVPLAVLAALNLVLVSPRLGASDRARRFMARVVWAEVALAGLILLAVGFLTAMEPARQTRSRELASAPGLEFEDRAEGARILASLQPGTIGDNSVVVHLNDRGGRPIENASIVSARMRFLGQELGEALEPGLYHGDGIWVIHSVPVGIAGSWELEVLVQRPDAFDANLAWRLDVSASAGQRGTLRPSVPTTRLLFGVQIALIGLVAAGAAVAVGGWASQRGRLLSAVGIAAVGIGAAFVVWSGALGTGDGLPAVNPIPRDQSSVDAGRRSYVANCQACHGESGAGDGPVRAGLPAAPADLTMHVPLHGDREIFQFVHDGLNTMPAFGDRLSDDEIWHLVNYLRTLTNVVDR